MKNGKSPVIIVSLATARALAMAVFFFWRGSRRTAVDTPNGSGERQFERDRGETQPDKPDIEQESDRTELADVAETAPDAITKKSVTESPVTPPDPVEVENAIVEEFDNVTDKWTKPVDGDIPMKDIYAFAESFARVPKNRRLESLQRALNLIPDDNIMILAGLLMNKQLDEEAMTAVFNDVLNRSDDVKQPLLNEIYKDKTHPRWADVAWIFDATGQKKVK